MQPKSNLSLKNILTIGISLALASLFMWWALKDLDIETIKTALSKANYFWVFVAALLGVLAYVFRAVRWNLLLEPMGYQMKNSNAFWAIAFGYLMNLTIPRSGEVGRATALFGTEKVPVEKSIATIVIERVVDLFFMLLFLLLTFIFNKEVLLTFYHSLTQYKSSDKKSISSLDQFLINSGITDTQNFYFWLKIGFVSIGFLIFLLLFNKFKTKIFDFFKDIIEGLKSAFYIKKRFLFFLYSAGIWICYFLSAYVVCFALQETSNFTMSDGFLIVTAGTLGMMVPTSGGAGSFHIAVKLAIGGIFVSLGKSQAEGEAIGLTYALISHTMQLVYMFIVGMIAIPMLARARK